MEMRSTAGDDNGSVELGTLLAWSSDASSSEAHLGAPGADEALAAPQDSGEAATAAAADEGLVKELYLLYQTLKVTSYW